VRVRQQNENALLLAPRLREHPAEARVHCPGLEGSPDHARATELFSGFGGMLAFEPKGGAAVTRAFMSRVRLPLVAPSLGGVESLVTQPALTSHGGMSREDRERVGITDALIRVSVGIEAVEDLIEDFERALEK